MSDCFFDLDINTQKLCTDAVRGSDKAITLLCNYFTSLPPEFQERFLGFSETFWDRRRKWGAKKYKITVNAILLANRIYKELGIACYPYIEKIATKGWGTAGGTFSWAMKLLSGRPEMEAEIYSFDPVKEFLIKNSVLDIGPYNGFCHVIDVYRPEDWAKLHPQEGDHHVSQQTEN